MKEEILLENTMELLESEGYSKGYEYLINNYKSLQPGEYPQVYYYFICITAALNKKEEAIKWLYKAVEEKGYWYRTEVLEDEDLDSICDELEFIRLKAISDERYKKALKHNKSMCTWKEKRKRDLMLCLHGNTENAEGALRNWRKLENNLVQVEAIQSGTVDCYGNYRWNYDDTNYKEVIQGINHISWESYENRYLSGFSAGCDMILRIIALSDIKCEKIFLQCPWIPFLQDHKELIVRACIEKNIKVSIYGGEKDEDTRKMCEELYSLLKDAQVETTYFVHPGIRHGFPEVMVGKYDFI